MLNPPFANIDQLRAYFIDVGYSEGGFSKQLGSADAPLPQLRNLPRLLEKTREPTALNLLIRWFLGNVTIPKQDVEAAGIPDWVIETCLQTGLLQVDRDYFMPTVQIVTCGDLLVASDTYQHLYSTQGYDHVLTINPAARHLLNFTLRQPVSTVLDLATGNGIQALLAATHSERVIATDLNPRASIYAEFNAHLNGLANIQCLTGDMLQPVQGQMFDQIVCNPPFVLTPSKDYLYRDNDQALDGLCQQLVQSAPNHLNEGGFFQMICEWVELKGQSWENRVGQWFQNNGCDVWVLKQYSQEPSQYALTRLRETLQQSQERDETLFEQWMDYYRQHQVEAIHSGLIAMRRRSGNNNWLSIEEISGNVQQPFGDLILQRFQNRDFLLASIDDHALLQARLKLHPDARLKHECHWQEGAWQTQSLTLSLARDLTQKVGVDSQIAQFVAQCDGEKNLGELVGALTSTVQAKPEQVRLECLRTVRFLLQRGFLLVAL